VRSKRDLPSLAQERGLASGLSLEEPLSKHTSYRIGGPAEFFAAAESVDQLCSWVELARELEQPLLVMGQGTNLLVADRGCRGLVIVNRCREFALELASHRVRAQAGVSLTHLARQTAETGSAGLEWAVGIPGTVGGAIVNNAGAYEGDMAGVIRTVRILDGRGEVRELAPGELELGYRTSRFREAASGKEIVLSADLQLLPEEAALLRERLNEYTARRSKAQPRGRSAGSVARQLYHQQGARKSRRRTPAHRRGPREGPAPVRRRSGTGDRTGG
jgi:UDP-N-acetylmuramate dehydrogenase